MNSGIVDIPDAAWRELIGHLLPPHCNLEQGAFVLASHEWTPEHGFILKHVESILLNRSDFSLQFGDYLELADDTRARIIKRAHDLKCAIVEFHSHPGPFAACLSQADMLGLAEFIPHIMWRLKERPYAAVVVAKTGFDGLLWSAGQENPEAVICIRVDGKGLASTGLSKSMLDRGHYDEQV